MTGFADGAAMICQTGAGRMRGIVAKDAESGRHGIGGLIANSPACIGIPCRDSGSQQTPSE